MSSKLIEITKMAAVMASSRRKWRARGRSCGNEGMGTACTHLAYKPCPTLAIPVPRSYDLQVPRAADERILADDRQHRADLVAAGYGWDGAGRCEIAPCAGREVECDADLVPGQGRHHDPPLLEHGDVGP